jgi:alkylation response protein AidB-like acyl-CoA dehydrogenase
MTGTLQGHLSSTHPLSPATAVGGLSQLGRRLAAYEPATLWELDTATLPRPLRAYRRRLRDVGEVVLRPRALEGDTGDPAVTVEVLHTAARAGLLSDLLPWPLGSGDPRRGRFPLQLLSALKMEELCAACGGLGLAIGAHALGAAPLLLAGEPATIRRHLLPALRENREGRLHVLAYAITEPAGGSDVEDGHGAAGYHPGTVASRVPGGWSLRGRKVFISGGDVARTVMVFAALAGEDMRSWTCFAVPTDASGFAVGRHELKMGQRASAAAEVVLDDVVVGDDSVVAGLRNGWALNRTVLNYSRVPVGAIALGIARGAFEEALRFARTHRVAGRAVADHQEAQLALAQMAIDTAAMRALVWRSAHEWVPRQAAASTTKVFCSDTAVRVCETAMELLGAHGLLHANRAEKAYRDARLTQIYEGTNQINRLAIVEDQLHEFAPAEEIPS